MTNDPVLVWKVVSVLAWVVILLLGIVGWFLRSRVAEMDQAKHELERRVEMVKAEFERRHEVVKAESERREHELEQQLEAVKIGLERRVHELELKGAENNVYVQQAVAGLSSIGELRAEIAARYLTRSDWAVMDGKMTKLHDRISDLFRLFATAGVQVPRSGGENG